MPSGRPLREPTEICVTVDTEFSIGGAFADPAACRGHERVIITCDERNQASIRGIVRGGFELKRAISSLIILARLVIQKVRIDQAVHWRIARL